MVGNGFSRIIFSRMPEWGELFDDINCTSSPKINIKNPTFLYEACLLRNRLLDGAFKEKLISRIKNYIYSDGVNENIDDLETFGEYLAKKHIENIITTNFDKGLEFILCEKCGYEAVPPCEAEIKNFEKIYSLRRYFKFQKNDHTVTLWKIHGDTDNLASVSLGFDQYCGSLAKLDNYIKGNYKSSCGLSCNTPIRDKCEGKPFDNLSWAELFFKTNVYILGYGMSFSEIDIWWLLNKRIRFINQGVPIDNKIRYLKNKYDTNEEIFIALSSFGVECSEIELGVKYLQSAFANIG